MPFQKGNKLGTGRPRKPEIEELRLALDAAKKKHGKSFLEHFVDRAFKDDACAIALGKKILPDLTQDDGLKDVVRTFLVRPGNVKETTE